MRATATSAAIVTALVSAVGCATRPRAPVLNVERYGNGPTTVIVLHGGPGLSHSYLLPEWKRVLDSTRRVLFYDQRGCGRSTRQGPFTWQQHVDDLDRLILESRSKRGGPVILAGSSWGGWLALLYTYRHPDRITALVLSGVAPWPDTAVVSRMYARLGESTRATVDSINAGLPASLFQADSALSIKIFSSPPYDKFAPRFGPFCVDARAAIWASLRTIPPIDSLRSIAVPVLIVHGTQPSPIRDGAPALAAVLPHSVLREIPSAGHDPWFDQPDSTFAVVNAFIDRVARP